MYISEIFSAYFDRFECIIAELFMCCLVHELTSPGITKARIIMTVYIF